MDPEHIKYWKIYLVMKLFYYNISVALESLICQEDPQNHMVKQKSYYLIKETSYIQCQLIF
jgi:hypothetical protein